ATIEKIAINCAMAGCRPEYTPVVVAAVEAMLEAKFNLNGVQCTTHSCEPLVMVSGPIVQQLGFATAEAVFGGGGGRPNATIGRAVRLILWNVGGGYPGEPCKEIIGHPGRYSFCVPEDGVNSPWPPIHADYGLPAEANAVTVFACEAPHSTGVFFGTDLSAKMICDVIADTMSAKGTNNTHVMGESLVVFSPIAAKHVADDGWSKRDVRKYLFEKARRRLGDLRPVSPRRPNLDAEHWYPWWPKWVNQASEDTMVPVVERPEAIHVIVTGGHGIPFCSVCPGWGDYGGFAVSREIRLPSQ
ncbi:MAG: hypothetical protein HY329_02830, partial [Chloroflexi bacterium]|nr:hypothetical protein [Chloroflexota bacterium]